LQAPWVLQPLTPPQLWLPVQPSSVASRQILRQVPAKQAWPPAQLEVLLQEAPCLPLPVSEQTGCSLLSSQQPSVGAQPLSQTGSQEVVTGTQAPALQALPVPQEPQLPPQPLSPQTLPLQLGVQRQAPALQVLPAPQEPQLPPQPSSPQTLPLQAGLQRQAPALQVLPAPQEPQLPPQPSSPQTLPLQAGLHWLIEIQYGAVRSQTPSPEQSSSKP